MAISRLPWPSWIFLDLRLAFACPVYAQWSIDFEDFLLKATGLPRFAVKINIPYLTLGDTISMMADLAMSIAGGSNGDNGGGGGGGMEFSSALDDIVKADMCAHTFPQLSPFPQLPPCISTALTLPFHSAHPPFPHVSPQVRLRRALHD